MTPAFPTRRSSDLNAETRAVTKTVADDIADCCKTVVGLEDKFIDLAFEMGPVEGMTPEDIKAYIRFIADWRLRQLHLPPLYGVTENPLPWLQQMLSGVEHANFFEARSTEYSKAATRGQWHGADGVWEAFDRMEANRAAALPHYTPCETAASRHAPPARDGPPHRHPGYQTRRTT